MAAHRYWRVKITATQDATECMIRELKMLSAWASPTLLSTGGTPYASSEYSAAYSADKSFDDDTETGWVAGSGSSMPQSLGYDLGSGNDAEVNVILIQSHENDWSDRAPKDFTVQYSDNDSDWYDWWSESDVTWDKDSSIQIFGKNAPPVTDDGWFWRLNVSDPGSDPNYIEFTELEFRATTGGADQCTGGIPYVSSHYPNEDYNAESLFDDNTATKWLGQLDYLPISLSYCFLQPTTVTEIALSSLAAARGAEAFTIERSWNGIDWIPVKYHGNITWGASEQKTFLTTPDISAVRNNQTVIEILSQQPKVRNNQTVIEILSQQPKVRNNQTVIEILSQQPKVRNNQTVIEILRKVDFNSALDIDAEIPVADISTTGEVVSDSIVKVTTKSLKLKGKNTNNAKAGIEFPITGPATVTFQWKVDSELNLDKLKVYVDEDPKHSYSGADQPWQQKTVTIGAGEQILKFEYEKNGSTNVGEDAGWIDALVISSGGASRMFLA